MAFKNYVRKSWAPAEDADAVAVPQADRDAIKTHLPTLMLTAPGPVQSQLGAALALAAEADFPAQWPMLLPELVAKLGDGDLSVVRGALEALKALFECYRTAFRSDELLMELKYVLELVAGKKEVGVDGAESYGKQPLYELLAATSARLKAAAGNPVALKPLIEIQQLVVEVFLSLNSVDLPEIFEDTQKEWMTELHVFLGMSAEGLAPRDADQESCVDALKASVCEVINLYIEKNEEEFRDYLQTFVTAVWGLLMSVGPSTAQDRLTVTAIKFLTTVSKSVHHGLFSDEGTLKQICERVVLPNLQIRDEDEELFEMNWLDYVRRDMEGSDSDTRRRTACELVKGLSVHYEARVTALFSEYVTAMLGQYAANPAGAWKAKDCAIYLVVALTVRGKTAKDGATSTNQLVNIADFFAQHVQPELQSADLEAVPVLKADAIKFLTTFRSLLPPELLLSMLPVLGNLLGCQANVVHTYAADAIERILALRAPREQGGGTKLQAAQVAPLAAALLERLFGALALPESQHNEYVMKAVMRVLAFLGAAARPFAQTVVQKLGATLKEMCANPPNPGFAHFLFESLAAVVRHLATGSVSERHALLEQVEAVLIGAQFEGPFMAVLQMDVVDYAPYVFQVLAQLVEAREVSPATPLPPIYLQMYPPLLTPMYWERPSNIPGLVRLLQAYLTKAAAEVAQGEQLERLLGVFRKLVSSRAHDHHGFMVLNVLVEGLPLQNLAQYMPTVWQLLFTRLQQSGTAKYRRSLLVFISVFACKHGVAQLEQSVNTVQPGMLMMLITQVWLASASLVAGPVDRKAQNVALTKLLTEWPVLWADRATWGKALTAVATLLAAGGDGEGGDEEGDAPVEYTGTYVRLANASTAEHDPLAEVKDAGAVLAAKLGEFSASQPGQVAPAIQAGVSAEAQAKLQAVLQAHQVALR